MAPGERVALMGRNGAGKSTLLRHAAGLMTATRGTVRSAGRVALLLQNPTDYLVHETVAAEASTGALAAVGLDGESFAARHPRDLSGGEKQRLALAVVLGDTTDAQASPAVVCLDEPTRGMDRDHKQGAQEVTATVTGTVTDYDGSGSCGRERSSQVGGARSGLYRGNQRPTACIVSTNLPIGNYEVKVEKSGFATVAYPAFHAIVEPGSANRRDDEGWPGQRNR